MKIRSNPRKNHISNARDARAKTIISKFPAAFRDVFRLSADRTPPPAQNRPPRVRKGVVEGRPREKYVCW